MGCKTCGGGTIRGGSNQTAKTKFLNANNGTTITVSDGTKLLIDNSKNKAIKLS